MRGESGCEKRTTASSRTRFVQPTSCVVWKIFSGNTRQTVGGTIWKSGTKNRDEGGCKDARKKCLGLPPYSPAPVLMSSRCGERVSGLACRRVGHAEDAIQRVIWVPFSSHWVSDVIVPLRRIDSRDFCPFSCHCVARPSSTPSRYVFSLHFCVLAIATQTNAVITVVNASQTQNFISF